MKKIKFHFNDVVFLGFLVIFFMPPIFGLSLGLYKIRITFDILKILSFFSAIFFCLSGHIKLKENIRTVVALFLFMLPILLMTFIYSGNKNSAALSFITVATATIVLSHFLFVDKARTIKITSSYLFLLCIINFVLQVFFPNGLQTDNATGVYWLFGNSNSCGSYILPCICLLFYLAYKEKRIMPFLFSCPCIASVFMTRSKTSIVGLLLFLVMCCFALLYVKLFKKPGPIFNINTYYVIAAICFLLIVMFQRTDVFSLVIENVLQKDLTLSDRTFAWNRAIDAIVDNPLGHGMQTRDQILVELGFSHAHDFYLHILYEGGILSFAGFLLLLHFCRKGFCSDFRGAFVFASSIFTFLIMFISEVYDERYYFLPIMLVLLIPAVEYSKQMDMKRRCIRCGRQFTIEG